MKEDNIGVDVAFLLRSVFRKLWTKQFEAIPHEVQYQLPIYLTLEIPNPESQRKQILEFYPGTSRHRMWCTFFVLWREMVLTVEIM